MEVLYVGRETIKHVYFPGGGLISLLIVMADGTVREIGVIGKEGMFGTAVALGLKTTPTRAHPVAGQRHAHEGRRAAGRTRARRRTPERAATLRPRAGRRVRDEALVHGDDARRDPLRGDEGRRPTPKGEVNSLHTGQVTVLDRNRLEAIVCECYGVVKAEYARNAHNERS
jgi:hypothetical protein